MLFNAHVHMCQLGRDLSPKYAEHFLEVLAGRTSWMTGEPWTVRDFTPDGETLISHMDEAGVDRALIMPIAVLTQDSYDPTMAEYISGLCQSYPDRLVGYYSADPLGGAKEAARLRNAVENLGLSGLKLLPAYNHVAIKDRRIWPLYETAADLGVPITLHTGWSSLRTGKSLEYDHPLQIEDALVDFPDLRVTIAHCGMAWSELVLMLMAKMPNVAADFAYWPPTQPPWRAAQTLSMAKYLGVLDRLFWGTDYPFTDFVSDLRYWRSIPLVADRLGLDPTVTDDDIDAFLGPNFAAFLARAESSRGAVGATDSSALS